MSARMWLCAAAILASLMAVAAFVTPEGAWPLGIAAAVCAIIANFDRINEISASASGFRMVLREAKAQVQETKKLVELMAELSLSLIQRSGRWGSFSNEEKERFFQETLNLLRATGTSEETIQRIREASWDRFVRFDYAFAALGNNTVPATQDNALIEEWKALRSFDNIPAPDAIEAFLTKMNALHGLRKELLDEYRFYIVNRYHRRPEIWEQRRNAPQIPR